MMIVFGIQSKANRKLYATTRHLTQLIFNLFENAIVNTPENTPITVKSKSIDKGIELIIADHGTEIAEAQRQKVFQPFYRLEQSCTTTRNGLGLSIVAAIVELHDSIIILTDNQPRLKIVVNLAL